MMSAQLQTIHPPLAKKESRISTITAVAIFIALFLTILLFFIARFPLLASSGTGLLGAATTLIGGAFVHYYRHKEPVWAIAICGQVLGLVGIALLFIAALISL